MINRGAVIITYREPMVRWINEANPSHDGPGIKAEDLKNERTVYLISEEDVASAKAVEHWVGANFKALFESELYGWWTDTDLWPQHRTLALFHDWFEVEYHSIILDTVGGEICDDEV